jgi:hypothetical protein
LRKPKVSATYRGTERVVTVIESKLKLVKVALKIAAGTEPLAVASGTRTQLLNVDQLRVESLVIALGFVGRGRALRP